jgi:uncharacterized OB-fold protein
MEAAPQAGLEAAEDDSGDRELHRPTFACELCGSTRVIPDQVLEDQGKRSDGELHTVVYARPQAWIFRDALRGKLLANICGDCGHVELHVSNPGELYRHYRSSHTSAES